VIPEDLYRTLDRSGRDGVRRYCWDVAAWPFRRQMCFVKYLKIKNCLPCAYMYIHTYIPRTYMCVCVCSYIIVHVPPRQHRKNAAVQQRTAAQLICIYARVQYRRSERGAWEYLLDYGYTRVHVLHPHVEHYCDISLAVVCTVVGGATGASCLPSTHMRT
jgi:hypothetical protein